ncbi:hypothetical protein CI105_02540 [Candidatus Izimaplasma bacterium ZiA1]|uniref:hypothetical protein n=1 Tax=Candidatus Izimoplasma sp. ZiA1 TaxID=2024899 RepID=UPI000BAA574F|nr:hypothetical protein CI105_02540 [Candidatus Izimaplasma bacterium ZiA1]
MVAIENLLTNQDLILKGFNRILGRETVNVAYNDNNEMICFFYNFDNNSKKILELYLKKNNIKYKQIKNEVYKRRSDIYEVLVLNKIVLLDKKFCLYKDVIKLAQFENIKGYKNKVPKFGLNQYFRIKKLKS